MIDEPENLRGYAHVVDGVVINVSLWDGVQPYDAGDGVEMVPLPYTTDEDGTRRYQGGIGWDYNPKATKNKFVDNRPQEDLDGLD